MTQITQRRRAAVPPAIRALFLAVLCVCAAGRGHQAVGAAPVVATVPCGQNVLDVALDARTRHGVAIATDGVSGEVVTFDLVTGAVMHEVTASGTATGLAVDGRRGRAFVTIAAGVDAAPGPSTLLTLDTRSGAVYRRASLGPEAEVIGLDQRRGRLFVLTVRGGQGRADMVDTGTGQIRRVVSLGRVDPQSAGAGVLGRALDPARGRVFVATQATQPSGQARDTLSVLDTATGALVRSIPLAADDPLPAIPITLDATRGRVFADGRDGGADTIAVVDETSGRRVGTIKPGLTGFAWIEDAASGHIFAGRQGRLETLDARTGRLLHTASIPADEDAPYDLAVVPTTGRLFVLAASGDTAHIHEHDHLSVLDTRTGALVRTMALGPLAYTIAGVDPRTRRVFLSAEGLHNKDNYTGPGQFRVADGRTGHIRASVAVGTDPGQAVVDGRTGRVYLLDSPDVDLITPVFGASAAP